jgi:hypothetical protein
MNWTAVGAIAEAIGALGVIISLLYLASQVRQNTKWSKAATRQSLADGAQRLASDVVEGDDIARILWDAMDGEHVAPHERFRLQSRCLRDLRFWDNAYYQYTQGLLTDEEWEGFRENLKLVFQFPTYREYWDRFQMMFSTSFRRELNGLLSTGQPFDLREAFSRSKEGLQSIPGEPPNQPL